MPPDEHESPVTDWLDDPTRQRELEIIRHRFPRWDEYQRLNFVLLFDIVDALDCYGHSLSFLSDDEEDEDSDTTGWKP